MFFISRHLVKTSVYVGQSIFELEIPLRMIEVVPKDLFSSYFHKRKLQLIRSL